MKKTLDHLQITLDTIKVADSIYTTGSEVHDLYRLTANGALLSQVRKLVEEGLKIVNAAYDSALDNLVDAECDGSEEDLIDHALTRLPDLQDALSNLLEDLDGLVET